MNSKEHHVDLLVMKFISSCMKIRDSLLVMQLNLSRLSLVLFILYFDSHMHAFAVLYNDAVMQIKQFITIAIKSTLNRPYSDFNVLRRKLSLGALVKIRQRR